MLPCLDQITEDGCFAERPTCLKAVQSLHKHKTIAVGPYEDRHLLTHVHNRYRKLVYRLAL